MAKGDSKVVIKSQLDRIIMHGNIVIMPQEILEVDRASVEELIDKGYCKIVKSREV